MALALRLPSPHAGLKSAGRVRLDRKIRNVIRPSLRIACYVNRVRVYPAGDGMFITASRVHSERAPRLGQVQCLAETNGAGMEAPLTSAQMEEGGFRNWLASNLCRVELSEFRALFVKFMANLQLLGILAALALGMRPAPARASAASPTYSSARNLVSDSVEKASPLSDQPSDFEKIEGDTIRSGGRQIGGLSQRTVGHTRGIDKLRFDMSIVP